jgi:hypothetical protein
MILLATFAPIYNFLTQRHHKYQELTKIRSHHYYHNLSPFQLIKQNAVTVVIVLLITISQEVVQPIPIPMISNSMNNNGVENQHNSITLYSDTNFRGNYSQNE